MTETPRILLPTDRVIAEWLTTEVCRFYVEVRRKSCGPEELLDLTLSAPICPGCASSDSFPPNGPPDISPRTWKEDTSWEVGEEVVEMACKERRRDRDFGFICKRCGRLLRPWQGDELFVLSYHVEEHYRFPLIPPRQVNPSRDMRRRILKLYGNKCFACEETRNLHIDHINPRSNGGDGAFRNLQPLCEAHGQAKGAVIPEEVPVHYPMYFGPYPSDGYEGLFW